MLITSSCLNSGGFKGTMLYVESSCTSNVVRRAGKMVGQMNIIAQFSFLSTYPEQKLSNPFLVVLLLKIYNNQIKLKYVLELKISCLSYLQRGVSKHVTRCCSDCGTFGRWFALARLRVRVKPCRGNTTLLNSGSSSASAWIGIKSPDVVAALSLK